VSGQCGSGRGYAGAMRVAVCQLNSRGDRGANQKVALDLLAQAATAGADLAVLPEYTDYLGPGRDAPPPEPVDGPYLAAFAEAAAVHRMWVVAGSFHEAGAEGGRTYNTSVVFDRAGTVAATYRKIHLYDVEIPGRVSFHESRSVAAGDTTATVDIDGVRVGLSICYDLRFPELYRRLVDDGAQVLLVPSAFMLHTGRDHWEVLLRARAVENQCYVVAAAQIGDHEPGRTCYGRSMIVDPWGLVLAQAADGVGVTVGDLDVERLRRIRAELPSLTHRRLP
jgi:deaminated glutathione amidase